MGLAPRLLFGGAALALAGVVALQAWATLRRQPKETLSAKLVTVLPDEIDGAKTKDEAIAASEEMKKAVTELLDYDDAAFRIYQLPRQRVSVYVAYWKAGKMSPRLVAGHTPDVCWPGNGWVRDEGAEREQVNLPRRLAEAGFLPGETRVFTAQGRPEYVVFWHKVGSGIQNYGTGHAAPWWAMFDELWRHGLNLRQEQIFVRVSSDVPLEHIFQGHEFEPLRTALLKLGLQRSLDTPRDAGPAEVWLKNIGGL